jgi:phosphotransferase system  glucose/maltose/N-acetylglucosamine-specific IIC component
VIQSQPRTVYVDRGHGALHGPLTVLLVIWALALPVVLLMLTGLGPIGWLLGAGLAFLFGIPWLVGLGVVWFLRRLT